MQRGLASIYQSYELGFSLFSVKVIIFVNLKVELVKLTMNQPVDLIAFKQRAPVNILIVPDQVEKDRPWVDELFAFEEVRGRGLHDDFTLEDYVEKSAHLAILEDIIVLIAFVEPNVAEEHVKRFFL